MNTIRIAVVGLGSRGTLTWIPQIQNMEGCRITAICDPIAALHDNARAQLKNPTEVKTHTRYEDVLADENVDAVALAVRCKEQGAMAAQALEAGKHVNCEVPAAHTLEDCWRIVVAQERSGRVYHLAEQLRYAGYVQAWRKLVAEGTLGKITYAEGQYFHYYVVKCFQDPRTGQFYHPNEIASHPEAQRTWLHDMPPIHYLPHDLSPVLKVLDDRVVEVMGMSTDSPSSAHPQLTWPDLQVALMKTAKGAVLRMAVSFSQPHPGGDYHWQQVIGTRGSVEWRRSTHEKSKLWLADLQMDQKMDADWSWGPADATPEARASGHGGLDYYVHAAFRDAVLGVKPLEFDVYRAIETAAPAILAAQSITQDGAKLGVPSFRPGAERSVAQMPKS
ncbi:MAG: Gfo/Idh/MocA family oxidoreductase [Verrucomicrobia bacterium]|nr:Gfo/Idh/MocA family oxidoreductase [Verrucomicrobiota bacterium]